MSKSNIVYLNSVFLSLIFSIFYYLASTKLIWSSRTRRVFFLLGNGTTFFWRFVLFNRFPSSQIVKSACLDAPKMLRVSGRVRLYAFWTAFPPYTTYRNRQWLSIFISAPPAPLPSFALPLSTFRVQLYTYLQLLYRFPLCIFFSIVKNYRGTGMYYLYIPPNVLPRQWQYSPFEQLLVSLCSVCF